jgi:uncharacterized ferredoxin-like protein
MSIMFEEGVRVSSVKDVATKMMLAARTAPKARGADNLVIALAEKEAIKKIAAAMQALAEESPDLPMAPAFLRDAKNILNSEILFLIGTKIKPLGLGVGCGLCGFASCQEKSSHPNIPCAFNTGDLGIALGSAVSIAMDYRVDNRIMYTVGQVVRKLGLLGDEVKICFGVPLSATGKNIFFDRKV